jgi:predicted nucleotidyltransferase
MVEIANIQDANQITSTLRAALPELRARWPIGSLALFGSRMRDDAQPGSDLDVLVTFDRPIPMSSFLALEDRLSAISGLKVDLVSTAALKPYMGARIRAEAITL